MKNKLIINHIAFRILAPIVTGTLVYILILMIFDSLSQLANNFFSQEVLFVILITLALFESLRFSCLFIEKRTPLIEKMRSSIIIQFSVNIVISWVVVSTFIFYYFKLSLGYVIFNTELITFNSLFVLITILYTSFYLGITVLSQKNESELNKELSLIESIEFELTSFKKEINPDLFFGCLETLISLLHVDQDKADSFLNRFSKIYRYILDHKKQEFVTLNQELENLENLIFLQNIRFNNQISFNHNITKKEGGNSIIPCTLQVIAENAIKQNIINQLVELKINCQVENNTLIFRNTYNPKLKTSRLNNNFSNIKKSYQYYTNQNIIKNITRDGWYEIRIPIPKLEN